MLMNKQPYSCHQRHLMNPQGKSLTNMNKSTNNKGAYKTLFPIRKKKSFIKTFFIIANTENSKCTESKTLKVIVLWC